jgi:aspartate/methionine/tyrosine aminotransferase
MSAHKRILRQSMRLEQVQSPVIPVVGELIRRHPGTISLGQGVVNYGPPPQVRQGIDQFFSDPQNHKYKPVQGIPQLLEALEEKLRAENGIQLDERRALVVTAGGNMAFVNALLAVADVGDEVILQTPYYFNHEMAVTMAGCKPVCVPTDANYQLRPDAIRSAITPQTRAVVTISPNNPTGAVYAEPALREVNGLCRSAGLFHIHDEAYEYFVYGTTRHFSPGSLDFNLPHTISLFSLSKSHGFASWRIGYMIVPADLLPAIKKIQDTLLICPPVISQFAAAGALSAGPDYPRRHVQELSHVREMVKSELDQVKERISVPRADGAFYFLPRVQTKLSAMALTERLVKEFGVAVIPGNTFGIEEGCTIRVAYGALSKDTVAEGMGRLVRGLKAIN